LTATRYDHASLVEFASQLGTKAGLPPERARVQAEVLVEADLMGHTTHGLAMLPNFLKALESGAMRATGEPEVVSDRGSAVVWDADRLPGTWLLSRAIGEACARTAEHPVVSFAIRRIGSIAALGAYLRQATDRGLVITIMNSDPAMRTVAPAGSVQGQFAPNPLAFGYPTDGDPCLIDISTSPVANGWVRRWHAEKTKMPAKWVQDPEGNLSDDPATLLGDPAGTMLPLGGLEAGHKGFGLALMVEVLTAGLTGLGRADKVTGGGTPVFLQIIDPDAFAGKAALKREAGWLAEACRASKPRPGVAAVRMPGDGALARHRSQVAGGVELYASIMPELAKWAQKLGVTQPAARS